MKISAKGFPVYLETIAASDAGDFAKQINDPEILKGVSNPASPMPYPYTNEHAINFIRTLHDAHLQGRMVSFAIRSAKTKEFLGSVGISEIDAKGRSCEILYWLGRKHWGSGYAKAAVKLALAYAFGKLGMAKVEAFVYPDNERSISFSKSAGFVELGALGDGKSERIMLAIFKRDYKDNTVIKVVQ